jgi:hypothetical protein
VEENGKGVISNWYVNKIDAAVDYAVSKGISVMGTWWCTPGWANSGNSDAPPDDLSEYARSAQWAADHWKGRIDAWEVWNEPDLADFWAGTQQQYIDMLKLAYPKFKAGNPNVQVILGGPTSADDQWLAQAYALGAKNYFDIVSMHPYQGKQDEPPEYPDDGNKWWFTHIPAVRTVMVNNGDSAKKIWFTEFGWSAHGNAAGTEPWNLGVTEAQQADYFVRAVQYAKANYPYVTNMIWYTERNLTSGNIHQDNFGLLRFDLTPKPAYNSIKTYLESQ